MGGDIYFIIDASSWVFRFASRWAAMDPTADRSHVGVRKAGRAWIRVVVIGPQMTV
jgi:hypothetical protein